MTPFFITGFLRSGTTLLEKYFHNHPQMVAASQPFPFLYKAIKEALYQKLDVAIPRYPLGHLFGETAYDRQAFLKHAQTYVFEDGEVECIFDQMRNYTGQLTPAVLDITTKGGTLIDIMRDSATIFPNLFGEPEALYAGSKEVFCEEYIPVFLSEDIPTVLIIRDPRAVVASIHRGSGGTYASSELSILHILRCWRKSVAHAICFEGRPGFHWMTYEGLARDPGACLQPIAESFGLSEFPESVLSGVLKSQDGSAWRGNSSFSASKEKRSHFDELLDVETIAFIDTICHAEMVWLNMEHSVSPIEMALESFRDPFQPEKLGLFEDEKREERHRFNLLEKDVVTPKEAETWFVYPSVREQLRSSLYP